MLAMYIFSKFDYSFIVGIRNKIVIDPNTTNTIKYCVFSLGVLVLFPEYFLWVRIWNSDWIVLSFTLYHKPITQTLPDNQEAGAYRSK